ncbi:M3 family metallopeptidase [Corynebacterium neomassiliense]|uniref:M3 family metallopeptidase n=1 Tax=Corynebacterium neomassiliense TaxID=2079482 RepID=UPI00103068C0|nr:M3 family metallopeptidase [Corynebacterium neomassiliense]
MNPLLEPSPLDHELPDFAAVRVSDLVPTFRTALQEHDAEIAAITGLSEPPTWENTMDALEASGQMLQRVLAIVFNYAGTDATDEITAVEETVAPELSAHNSRILLDRELYARVKAMPAQPEGSENAALLDHWLRAFRRGGADLDDAGREELAAIDTRLAELSTRFSRNLMESTVRNAVAVTDEAKLEGLDESRREQLRADAEAEGRQGWLIRLGLPAVQPVLEELADADLRREIASASRARGSAGAADNSGVVLETVRLRARRAELLGYAHHAEFVAEGETAGTVDAVEELLDTVTPAAVDNALGEHKRALDLAHVNGVEAETLGEADLPYWSARLREEDLAVDTSGLRKYFPLTRVLRDGVFYAAERLYGIRVTPRDDLAGYHPDVRVWEVSEGPDRGGESLGLLLTDLYARPTKRGGAWMSSFVDQNRLLGQTPVVVNVLNIARPAEGEEALLSLDEVTTLFHEFGHGLHGLLSDVRYPSLSGTNVPRDFVEFPSQINENWALEPEVLSHYARHVETGEPLPPDLVSAVKAEARWGQGVALTEFIAACRVDLAWHRLSSRRAAEVTDVAAFERAALEDAGLTVPGVGPRYSSTFFSHIFAGGYSADYWSYLWAEVLDADGFDGFVDTGAAAGEVTQHPDPDDVRFAGERFRRMILSRGATIDYDDAFWMFRGRQRSVAPLLSRRGLSGSGPVSG